MFCKRRNYKSQIEQDTSKQGMFCVYEALCSYILNVFIIGKQCFETRNMLHQSKKSSLNVLKNIIM
jgi:hypothetical protein